MLINKKKYKVQSTEFNVIPHREYNNLRLVHGLGVLERISSLVQEIGKELGIQTVAYVNPTHGGFLPIQSYGHFKKIAYVSESTTEDLARYCAMNETLAIPPLLFSETYTWIHEYAGDSGCIVVADSLEGWGWDVDSAVVITKDVSLHTDTRFHTLYHLSETDYYVYIPTLYKNRFAAAFHMFVEGKELTYDNLIHLCIMVKDAGPQFESMLQENMSLIDRWTILDTGSTDGTLDVIQRLLVGKKKGHLYQEPFLNFRDSRNRCLDLAGKTCKFNLMLDDTYVVRGNLRKFLNTVRGDQFADSYSLFIKSSDSQYASNRVTKSQSDLRYIFRIHEVITDKGNINVIVPESDAYIEDRRFPYMEQRTMQRKEMDLRFLYEEIEENPMEPRTYYYLGQTYNLLDQYDKAFSFFLKRCEFTNSGFIQERVDAAFEAARLANFKLNKPWEECLALYEKAYHIDPSRPDSIYFIGLHYYMKGDMKTAFSYFERAFKLGFPSHCQYSLKPTLSFHYLPKLLARMSYELEEYAIGEAAARLFLEKNPRTRENHLEILEIESWWGIYKKLNQTPIVQPVSWSEKPLFCFVADGGFSPWTGSDILHKGVGGSETYIIEMARYIQKTGTYQVLVFCHCLEESSFEGVVYKPLSQYGEFIGKTLVDHCIVSRFSEYLPMTYKGWVENVYLVLHDLTPSGNVIPMDPKLKRVFCLTEWHVSYLTAIFPALAPITVPFYYGIDVDKFGQVDTKQKIPHRFIYSSFPNRGLLVLLEMWPDIVAIQPEASLDIYSDVDGKWVNDVAKEHMDQIRALLVSYRERTDLHIHYHGWVDKQTLSQGWASADIWFYPCIFQETFCLTALEAALSQTCVVSNHLAALKNTVGDRGFVVPGDPMTPAWRNQALDCLRVILSQDAKTHREKEALVEANSAWARDLSWENRAADLLQRYIVPQNRFYKGLPWREKALHAVWQPVIHYFNKEYSKPGGFEPIRILEIGTYTGTTLIYLVSAIKHSLGLGIDLWKNHASTSKSKSESTLFLYMEENEVQSAFYKNVDAAGLEQRIQGMQVDSYDFFKKKGTHVMYDLIYVDGCDTLVGMYSDLLLAWQAVNKKGYVVVPIRTGVSAFVEKIKTECHSLERQGLCWIQRL